MMLGTLDTLCTDTLFDWLMPFPTQTQIRTLEVLHALGALCGDDARYVVHECQH